MDARAYRRSGGGLAASFEFDVYRDALTVSARMLTENRDEAADLLRAALVAPSFDEDAVERVRGQVLSIIDGDARDPDEIAGRPSTPWPGAITPMAARWKARGRASVR
jgi:zinc protease